MNTFLLIIHVIISLVLIGLVLIQHGKGADVGASFGSGASNTIFGSQGSGSFLAKATIILALVFAVNSIAIIKLTPKTTQDVVDVETLVLPENKAIAPVEPLEPVDPVAPVKNTEPDTKNN